MWDHAAGSVILECSGCRVSDIKGKRLDFEHGGKLQENYGILASLPDEHSSLVEYLGTIVKV